jgi:hypothetical protein
MSPRQFSTLIEFFGWPLGFTPPAARPIGGTRRIPNSRSTAIQGDLLRFLLERRIQLLEQNCRSASPRSSGQTRTRRIPATLAATERLTSSDDMLCQLLFGFGVLPRPALPPRPGSLGWYLLHGKRRPTRRASKTVRLQGDRASAESKKPARARNGKGGA